MAFCLSYNRKEQERLFCSRLLFCRFLDFVMRLCYTDNNRVRIDHQLYILVLRDVQIADSNGIADAHLTYVDRNLFYQSRRICLKRIS